MGSEKFKKELSKLTIKIRNQNLFMRQNLIKKIQKKMKILDKSNLKLKKIKKLKEEKEKKQIEWMNFKIGKIQFSYQKYLNYINSVITPEDLETTKDRLKIKMEKITVLEKKFDISDLKNILKAFCN